MKIKIAKGVGLFGLLTPVLAAGGLLVMLNNGLIPSTAFLIQIGAVSLFNAVGGYFILKRVAAEKKHA